LEIEKKDISQKIKPVATTSHQTVFNILQYSSKWMRFIKLRTLQAEDSWSPYGPAGE